MRRDECASPEQAELEGQGPTEMPACAEGAGSHGPSEGAAGSIGGRFFVTPHAVRAYLRRCRAGMTYEQALTHLIRASEQARWVKVLGTGAELWRTGKPERLRLVVRLVVRPGEAGRKPALVTVLTRAGAESDARKGGGGPKGGGIRAERKCLQCLKKNG